MIIIEKTKNIIFLYNLFVFDELYKYLNKFCY